MKAFLSVFREYRWVQWEFGYMSASQSLVLDSERGELVKSCTKMGKKGEGSEAKTVAALKSHSEAERRRRERINAHLATLRGLVPSNEKVSSIWIMFMCLNYGINSTQTMTSFGYLIVSMELPFIFRKYLLFEKVVW